MTTIGNRKMVMFFMTFIGILCIVFFALFSGVEFVGNDIVTIIVILGGYSGWMAGMNVGEWFMKTKIQNGK